MDILNLLAQEAAAGAPSLSDHWQTISAIVGGLLTAASAAVTALWKYFLKREEKREQERKEAEERREQERKEREEERKAAEEKRVATYQEVVAQKDALIAQKDAAFEDLSKKLSKKSDDMAEKIQELQGITLEKMESFGERFVGQQEKIIGVMSDFSSAVRKLNIAVEPPE